MSQADDATPSAHYTRFAKKHPAIAEAHAKLGEAVRAAGPLTEREIALVKLALAVGAHTEGGVHAHARRAHAAGVERAAIEQVTLLAAPTLGFPHTMAAYSWLTDTLDDLEP